MKRYIMSSILALAVAATAPAAMVAEDTKANELLQSGTIKETIEGDLNAAISFYEAALKEAGSNRAIAARAQLRLGAAYQKQGNERARLVLEALLRDFADQSGTAAEARERLAALKLAAGQASAVRQMANLRVELSRFRGATRVATESHILDVQTDGTPAQAMAVSRLPLKLPGGEVSLRQIGTEVRSSVKLVAGGFYKVVVFINHGRIAEEKQAVSLATTETSVPSFDTFRVGLPLLMADRQVTRVALTDPVNDDNWHVELTLSVKK